jgi:hypothetical protein
VTARNSAVNSIFAPKSAAVTQRRRACVSKPVPIPFPVQMLIYRKLPHSLVARQKCS